MRKEKFQKKNILLDYISLIKNNYIIYNIFEEVLFYIRKLDAKKEKSEKSHKDINKIKNAKAKINLINKLFIIIIYIFIQILSCNGQFTSNYFSNITLRINGTGEKFIFGEDFRSIPNKIYINNIIQNEIKKSYYFNQTENFVELIWKHNNIDCPYMFRYCRDIIEINLTNFDTSQVQNMFNMFEGCTSLTSLDLSNFDTSNVKVMNSMFDNCTSLTSLDLSNFDTSQLLKMYYIFLNSINLKFINFSGFVESENLEVGSLFDGISDNLAICIDESNNKIISELKQKSCYTIDCSDNWISNQKQIVNKTGICYDINNNDIQFLYEYKGIYYEHCENGILLNNSKIDRCKCDLNYIDFYPKENDSLNTDSFINCYKEPEGYYLDVNDLVYKKCFYT